MFEVLGPLLHALPPYSLILLHSLTNFQYNPLPIKGKMKTKQKKKEKERKESVVAISEKIVGCTVAKILRFFPFNVMQFSPQTANELQRC